MTYIVTFEDFMPEPRYDNIPWARILINEGPASDGPWTPIDSIQLSPIDANPANPMSRSFTTDQATLPEGWYQVNFQDATGNDQGPVAPVHLASEDVLAYVPTVTQVAQLILTRTKDQYGNVHGTFDDQTKPTGTEVQDLAIDAAGLLSLKIGNEIPDALVNEARSVAAIRTAMDVELTYYSDQVNTGRSIYPQLKALWDEQLQVLTDAVGRAIDNGGVVAEARASTKAVGSFPAAATWDTRPW